MAEMVARIRVPAEASGTRLDQFLAEPLGSRAQAQRVIDEGRVRVDGRARRKSHEVSAGELIDIDEAEPTADAPVVAVSFGVAYEDDHLIVVDKPAGVVVHPARGHHSGTLAQALAGRAAGGDEPWRAGIVHRLDRDTSGLLVVAKRDDVHRALKELLASRRLRREYLALVAGTPEARTGTIEAPIGRDRRDRTLMSIDSDEPREARTHFEIVEVLRAVASDSAAVDVPDGSGVATAVSDSAAVDVSRASGVATATLLRIVLDTGRTHQIRVHLRAIGHPVCGDRQYGGGGVYGLARQFLHAARLAFPHPVTGEPVDVRSPLPPDLAAALVLAGAPPVVPG